MHLRLLIVVTASVLFHSSVPAQTLNFNATWWNHALSDEQQGFVYGYQDCRQPRHAVSGSIVDYQDFVTAHVTQSLNSVPKVIEAAERDMESRTVLKGGETWSGPHGYLNGDWWGLPDLNDSYQQRGYVEGFLVCTLGHEESQQVQHYVNQIRRHYSQPHTENDAIAEVLKPLLNPAPAGKAHHQ